MSDNRKPDIFVTGGGGFVGRQLLGRLLETTESRIICLAERTEDIALPAGCGARIETLRGDLLAPSGYAGHLADVGTVVHLAAITGKARPEQYQRVNVEGPRLLLDACVEAGVARFVFISSIAARFDETYRYFYAHSKAAAEEAVAHSGLAHTIIRPTMVFGAGSPVFDSMLRLAALPRAVVFGDGTSLVQPIHVADLAQVICDEATAGTHEGMVIEAGGPEVLSMGELLLRMARAAGRTDPRLLKLPVGAIARVLGLLERVAFGALPIVAGQLASFRNDCSARPLPEGAPPLAVSRTVDEMITDSMGHPDDTPPPGPLRRECRTLTRYLTGRKPSRYVESRYAACHERVNLRPRSGFDGLLIRVALLGLFFTRMVDAYCRFFFSNAALRRRLSYLVAILEVSPEHYRYFEQGGRRSPAGVVLRAGLHGFLVGLLLLLAVVLLLPLQILARLVPGRAAASES